MKKYWLFAALCLLFPLLSLNAQEQPQMNKKNLVVKEWNTDPKGGHKVLDHVTTYNAEGKKIEEIEYNTDGQKWRKRFDYDATGRLIKEYVYDHHNRLQTYKTFEFNEFAKKKVQYTYNPKGKLLSIKQYEYIAQ
jgi:hypothetical protein